jgi:ferritin-like metal-binding protein YciE
MKPLEEKTSHKSGLLTLLVEQLDQLYATETYLGKTLSELTSAASSESLREVLQDYAEVVTNQTYRLELIFGQLNQPRQPHTYDGMSGLIREARQAIEQTIEGSMTRDSGLILACQKICSYKESVYQSLCNFAESLGYSPVSHLLEKSLQDERDIRQVLTNAASLFFNRQASMESPRTPSPKFPNPRLN